MMSLYYTNERILHYDVIMLANIIPFHYDSVIMLHYTNLIMLIYVYICRKTFLVYVCIDNHVYVGRHA